MKTKLLFTKNTNKLIAIAMLSLCFNFGFAQNLMLNGDCDTHTASTGDNADAYDMTPNNTILDETGATVASPYQAVWDNDALEDWLEVFYLGAAGSLDEQPGSTSGGQTGRGIKLYDDGSPAITGSSRRIYQKVLGLTIGTDYTFALDSSAEAADTPSEVYMLNTEITDEAGLNANGAADASVDGFMSVANVNGFATDDLTFTATNTFVVVYIRSLNSVDGNTEVFYDNLSLKEFDPSLSTKEFSVSDVKIFPNPASDVITIQANNKIEVASVQVFDLLGKQVINSSLQNSKLDVSNLSNGVYMLKINAATGISITKKIIIE